MGARWDEFRQFYSIAGKSWFVRILLGLWGLLASYDLTLSQMVPEETAKQFPKGWQMAVMTGNLLPWWGWLLAFLGIVTMTSIEYAFRIRREFKAPELSKLPTNTHAPAGPPTGEQPTEPIPDETQLGFELGGRRRTLKIDPSPANAKLLLATLRSTGVAHRSFSNMISDDQVSDWIKQSELWSREVADTLEKVDETDAEMFRTLDTVPPARVNVHHLIVDPWTLAKFNGKYNQHDYRLFLLKGYLDKYQGRAS